MNRAAGNSLATASAASESVATPPRHEEPINILIVDDEPKNLTVLESILDDPRYRLVRSESADQALLALVAEEFALLILDIRMPGMTGFELAQMVKERKKTAQVPIIFLTAYYNEDQHVLEGYGSGAVDYLQKPVNAAILRSKVAVFAELHRRNLERETTNRALLAEVAERRRAEDQLRELNETLEQRVIERTEALHASEASERARRAELEALMDAIPAAVFIAHDPTCQHVTGNRAAMELFGAAHGDNPFADTSANGLARYEVWSKGRRLAPHEQPLQCAARTGQAVSDVELELVFSERERRHILGNALPLFDDAGAVRGGVGAFVDISARKRAEDALKDADRHKDEFLATLAHELRNPLAPVRNAIEVLHLKGPPAPELQWAMDVIARQVRTMTRLIDDLMDVSRISRNELHLRKEPVELEKVIQVAVETTRPLIDLQGHDLALTLPGEPVIINGDLTRLAQVFSNLLNNAAKYMEKGGHIALRAEQHGGEVAVSVRDTGIGIPADKLPTIFEMFSQVEGALSRSQGGLGIGLSLVKRLVEMHNGRIEAHSAGLGRGCEFTVHLPIVAKPPHVATNGETHTATPPSKLRVLVVDDNRDAASSLSLLLEMVGNSVRTAYDGEEAVHAANEFRPDVALIDIGLPKLNGYDVARTIRREAWGRIVILVAVTGWGQDNDKRMADAAGFDRHMVKPVDPQVLMQLMAEFARARQ